MSCRIPRLALAVFCHPWPNQKICEPSRFSGQSSYRFLAPWGPQNLVQNAQECFVVSSIWLYLTLSISILSPPSLTVSPVSLWAQQLSSSCNSGPRLVTSSKLLTTSDNVPTPENHGYGYTSNKSNTISTSRLVISHFAIENGYL